MKPTLTLLAFFSITCIWGQTTLEEYNYLTKGYKIQIESGLDMKKGYTLKDLVTVSTQFLVTRTATFKGLYRTGETSPCAILLIYQKYASPAEYVCIPHFKSDYSIWDLYQDRMKIFDNSVPALQTICLGLAKCTGYFSQR